MLTFNIGPIRLSVRSTSASEFADEVNTHLHRVTGSRGEAVEWVNQKYGPVRLVPEVESSDVILRMRSPEGPLPLVEGHLRRGDSDEVALSYTIGRLIRRGLLDLEEVREAPPLPSGRRLADLLAVQRSAIPQGLFTALGQLHTIGFAGLPKGAPTTRLCIADSIELPVFEVDARGLQAEVEELLVRMRDKIDRGAHTSPSTQLSSLRATLVGSALQLDSEDWSPAGIDLALLQWVMIHLLRPKKPNPFLPMRPLLIRPCDLSQAPPLPTGVYLPDLPAIRNQMMPAKVAQLLEDVHKHGSSYDQITLPANIPGRFGPLRLHFRGEDAEELAERSRELLAPLMTLFGRESDAEAKYGPVTLAVEAADGRIHFRSQSFRPGSPDEVLCEYLVATFLQDDTLPIEVVRDAPQISGRTLLGSPAIARQLMPGGTVDLLAHVHTGGRGSRRDSGWRHQIR